MSPAAPATDLMRSVGDYPLRQQDTEDRFFGKRLIYLAWDNHLMYAAPFCVPLPPTLPFGALVRDLLPELYGEHPEFESIDWQRTQWFTGAPRPASPAVPQGQSSRPAKPDLLGLKRFVPDFGKSLQHHGLTHKSLIRFVTPKLEGSRMTDDKGHQKF